METLPLKTDLQIQIQIINDNKLQSVDTYKYENMFKFQNS